MANYLIILSKITSFIFFTDKARLSEIETSKFFSQIISGIVYLKAINTTHRLFIKKSIR